MKGDRFGVWSHNSVSWIVAVVAAARAGLISVRVFFDKGEEDYSKLSLYVIIKLFPKHILFRSSVELDR